MLPSWCQKPGSLIAKPGPGKNFHEVLPEGLEFPKTRLRRQCIDASHTPEEAVTAGETVSLTLLKELTPGAEP